MAHRTSYAPGAFSWVELTTPEQEAAKRFYGGLFGWTFTDTPVSEGVVYTMAALDGQWVGAISPQPAQQREADVPPRWNSYVTVESADALLTRARELGANIHAGAFDVFDSGRMGVVQDLQGAYFMVWEPRGHVGAGLVNAPGALSWNELASPDVAESARFYGRLFGWTAEPFEGIGTDYLTVRTSDGRVNGGIRKAASTEPGYWMVYFGTADLRETMARVRALGGSPLMERPLEVPMGRLAAVQDPQGAVFSLFEGSFDD
jgi:predicted enzyme related to lactoylglutathione lyase